MTLQETKGLTLEQVDKMMEEVSPRKSASWKPYTTFAADMGLTQTGVVLEDDAKVETAPVEEVRHSIDEKAAK